MGDTCYTQRHLYMRMNNRLWPKNVGLCSTHAQILTTLCIEYPEPAFTAAAHFFRRQALSTAYCQAYDRHRTPPHCSQVDSRQDRNRIARPWRKDGRQGNVRETHVPNVLQAQNSHNI